MTAEPIPIVPPKSFLDLDAFTIVQFCERHGISRSTYYVLKARGLQPQETHILDRIIVTRESAAAWRRKRTAASRMKGRGRQSARLHTKDFSKKAGNVARRS
jgi:hypothetical protein